MNTIKLIILDVDGVMTDGKKYYDSTGKAAYKTFCDKDWTAIKLFKTMGIKVLLLSGDGFNKFIENARNIKIIINRDDKFHNDKSKYLEEILNEYNLKKDEVCFVGDDVFDIGLMKRLKHSYCPNDSPKIVKEYSSVLNSNGGNNLIMELYETLQKNDLIDTLDYDSLIDGLYQEDRKELF